VKALFAVTYHVRREGALAPRPSLLPEKEAAKPETGLHAIDPLGFYADAIDTSNYASAIAPVIRGAMGDIGDLLDVGAGGGQLGAALREPGGIWTTIEPSRLMAGRLARFSPPPAVLASGWRNAELASKSHDSVLAATMPAVLYDCERFLPRCLGWARRHVIWVVPSHHGPRGMILAGCLPSEWHGEDETPGIDITLGSLPAGSAPHVVERVDWTFTAVVTDLRLTANYLATRLKWPNGDARREALFAHLKERSTVQPNGHRLDIERQSAILIWRC
jgi:hypothetical protein